VPRLGEEVEEIALIELGLSDYASLQERFPALVECAVEEGKEDCGIFAEDMAVLVAQCAEDVHLAEDGVGAGSHCVYSLRV
jgi:hypothetical protein